MPKALKIKQTPGKPGQVYHPIYLDEVPVPSPGPKELIVQIHTAALNHKDYFLRQSLYPGIDASVPLLADGYGTVTAVGSDADPSWLHKKVIITPGQGWKESPDGPEGKYGNLGGTKIVPIGTCQELLTIHEDEVEVAPPHLSAAEAAALPLAGLTAWRAFVTKSKNAEEGRNILVTGIGGGVALFALQFAAARGCKVWVTSSSEEKLAKAKALGATGGVNYKQADWDKQLLAMLPKERPLFDAIIDGAGGDIIARGAKLLKLGGIVVSYGMTLGPKMDWSMTAVMKNIELRGSTMGSRKEFAEMMQFVREKEIKPVVSRVAKGLDIPLIDELFEEMGKGSQFGKLVIEISSDSGSPSKL